MAKRRVTNRARVWGGFVKIAIVHDWLVTYAGAERVLEQMLACYPDADLFTLVDFLGDDERGFLGGRRPVTSFVQRLPFARRRYRDYLPLMAHGVEQFDLSAYDLVISSSFAVAKGALTGPDQLHIAYVYSPMRYAWDLQHQYLRESGLTGGLRGLAARWMLHRMRLWDVRTAHGVDRYVAISRYIARRVRKAYGREASVINPPVDTAFFTPGRAPRRPDTYLTASRLVPYKRVDAIVAAFAHLSNRRLIVIGDGPQRRRIEAMAPANVTLLGRQPAESLRNHMRQARAFIFAAEEDFGIAPLEAQACGTPVIAFERGGARETIRGPDHDRPTGAFFAEQSPAAIAEAVRAFEAAPVPVEPADCRANAVAFGAERFRAEFMGFVEAAWDAHRAELAAPTWAPDPAHARLPAKPATKPATKPTSMRPARPTAKARRAGTGRAGAKGH